MEKVPLDGGELIGANDPQVGAGLQDLSRGNPHVVVIGERFLDQALQCLILEDRWPLHEREVFAGLLLRRLIGSHAAILVRYR